MACYKTIQNVLDLKSEPVEKFGIIALNTKMKSTGLHLIVKSALFLYNAYGIAWGIFVSPEVEKAWMDEVDLRWQRLRREKYSAYQRTIKAIKQTKLDKIH